MYAWTLYLLKLTASLAQVRKTLLYSIIFIRKFCTLACIISAHGCKVLSDNTDYGMYTVKLSYLNYLKSLTSQSA